MNDELPFGWQRPEQIAQTTLFPDRMEEVLAKASVSLDDVLYWKNLGWISFDPTNMLELDHPQVMELVFIRNIARSGLSIDIINNLLSSLEKPYCYQPRRVVYSFADGWVQLPPMLQDSDVCEFFEAHLDEWIRTRLMHDQAEVLTEVLLKLVGQLRSDEVRKIQMRDAHKIKAEEH